MKEKRTEEGFKKKREYMKRFVKEEMTPICFRFSKTKDDDIIKHLKKQKNKSQYMKELIRKDMKKSK